jgi:hypothetical protein
VRDDVFDGAVANNLSADDLVILTVPAQDDLFARELDRVGGGFAVWLAPALVNEDRSDLGIRVSRGEWLVCDQQDGLVRSRLSQTAPALMRLAVAKRRQRIAEEINTVSSCRLSDVARQGHDPEANLVVHTTDDTARRSSCLAGIGRAIV